MPLDVVKYFNEEELKVLYIKKNLFYRDQNFMIYPYPRFFLNVFSTDLTNLY